ncbi:hypothetical protein D1872_324520 [compost metagenome]
MGASCPVVSSNTRVVCVGSVAQAINSIIVPMNIMINPTNIIVRTAPIKYTVPTVWNMLCLNVSAIM